MKVLLTSVCMFLPFVMYLAPLSAFYLAWAYPHTHTLSISPLPLSSQTLQCFLWLVFAWYVESAEERLVLLVPNFFGFVLGLVYLVLYPRLAGGASGGTYTSVASTSSASVEAPPGDHAAGTPAGFFIEQFHSQLRILLGVSCFVLFLCGYHEVLTRFEQTQAQAKSSSRSSYLIDGVGYLACAVGLLMLSSPLFSMRQSLETKNVELMGSLWMNLATFLCTAAWTVQACIYLQNPQLAFLNGVGLLANSAVLLARWQLVRCGSLHASESLEDEDQHHGSDQPVLQDEVNMTTLTGGAKAHVFGKINSDSEDEDSEKAFFLEQSPTRSASSNSGRWDQCSPQFSEPPEDQQEPL